MTDAVPEPVRRYTVEDVDVQRTRWVPERWTTFADARRHAKLGAHSDEAGGSIGSLRRHAGSDASRCTTRSCYAATISMCWTCSVPQ
jgi:hypothetical protein